MDSWLDLFLLVFASFRLTRLIVYDTITEFLRAPFHETIVETMEDGRTETYIEVKGSGLRYWIGELLSCHWCTGFWTTVILYSSYALFPHFAMPIIIILAISGSGSIIQQWVSKED